MEFRDLSILTQVVYKEKSSLGAVTNWQDVIETTLKLAEAVEAVNKQFKSTLPAPPPFESRPAAVPKGQPYVGMPCPVCGVGYVASKQPGGEPWCRACWKVRKGLA
jgi:hypothetical protein